LNKVHKSPFVWSLLLVALVLTGCGGTAPAATQVKLVSPAGVYSRLPGDLDRGLILLDVRTPEEWLQDGHIEGATLIPLQELTRRAAVELPKDAEIIVYCRNGNRSAQAADYLARSGYSNISDMGGIINWVASGYPVVKGP
jgi:phage shock protein E